MMQLRFSRDNGAISIASVHMVTTEHNDNGQNMVLAPLCCEGSDGVMVSVGGKNEVFAHIILWNRRSVCNQPMTSNLQLADKKKF